MKQSEQYLVDYHFERSLPIERMETLGFSWRPLHPQTFNMHECSVIGLAGCQRAPFWLPNKAAGDGTTKVHQNVMANFAEELVRYSALAHL